MNSGFQVEAIMTRVSSLRDKGVSVGFHTQELTPEKRAAIMEFDGTLGWLLFKENEIKEDEIPKADADLEQKSQGARIRACLFVLWKQTGEKGNFLDYYNIQTEKIIDAIKAKFE